MERIKTMFMSLLWYTGAILEVATIPLSLAVLHEISITYEWFVMFIGVFLSVVAKYSIRSSLLSVSI